MATTTIGLHTKAAPAGWARAAAWLVAGVFLALAAADWIAYLAQPDRSLAAVDYRLYMDATARWLAGGPYFEPWQLTGPYGMDRLPILYPPTALPLFAVFTVLPAVLWWAVPIGGTAVIVARYRPSALAWAGIAVCLWFPATSVKVLTGNPVLWAVLAVACGTRWGWPGALALVKPSLFPFALVGVRTRGWWVAMALTAAAFAVMAPLTLEWVTALLNSRGGGLLYSVQEAPLMAVPVLAWAGRRR